MNPLFSIIVPVFNVQDYIEKCVNSVLSQTYNEFELVLVDDGATDNSGVLCDALAKKDSRIVVIHKKNGGLSDARNVGLVNSRGKYILFLDADDYYADASFLKRIVCCIFEKNPEVVIHCCMTYDLRNGNKRVSRGHYRITERSKEELLNYLYRSNNYPGSAWMVTVKRELLDNLNLSFPKGVTAEDYYWVCNVLHEASTIDIVNEAYYVYVINRAGSITTRVNISGVKGVLYCLEDWRNKINREKGITNFLAQTYLLTLMNFARLSMQEQSEIAKDIKNASYILSISSEFKYKLFRFIMSIIGINATGKLTRIAYRIASKR